MHYVTFTIDRIACCKVWTSVRAAESGPWTFSIKERRVRQAAPSQVFSASCHQVSVTLQLVF